MPFPIFDQGKVLFGAIGKPAHSRECCCVCCCARNGRSSSNPFFWQMAEIQKGKARKDPCCLIETKITNYEYILYSGVTPVQRWVGAEDRGFGVKVSCCCYAHGYYVYNRVGDNWVYGYYALDAGTIHPFFCYAFEGWHDGNDAALGGINSVGTGSTSLMGLGTCLGNVTATYEYSASQYATVTFDIEKTGVTVI